MSGIDKTHIKKGKMREAGNDLSYWLTKTPQERLEAADLISQEYNDWKYGSGQRLQRVYRIIKRT